MNKEVEQWYTKTQKKCDCVRWIVVPDMLPKTLTPWCGLNKNEKCKYNICPKRLKL